MSITTFRDTLMTENRDSFFYLIDAVNEMKAEFKKECRHVEPVYAAMIGYKAIKKVSKALATVLNKGRINQDAAISLFKSAAITLDILGREFFDTGALKLATMVREFYNIIISLLPINSTIQLALFDAEYYQSDSKKMPVAKSFIGWLKDYSLFGYERRDIARKMARKPLNIRQFSIRFSLA